MNIKWDKYGHVWTDFDSKEIAQIVKLVVGAEKLRQEELDEEKRKMEIAAKEAQFILETSKINSEIN